MFAAQPAIPRYIVLVSLIYVVAFLSVFVIVGEWPVFPPVATALFVAGFSALFAWGLASRIMRLWPKSEKPFLAPTLAHGAIWAAMLITALTV